MPQTPSSWLLLILSLPTQSATALMRIWRALKAQGCAALRDGAYLLPAGAEHETALRELAEECLHEEHPLGCGVPPLRRRCGG